MSHHAIQRPQAVTDRDIAQAFGGDPFATDEDAPAVTWRTPSGPCRVSRPVPAGRCAYCKGANDPIYGDPDTSERGVPLHSQCLDDERISHTDYEVIGARLT